MTAEILHRVFPDQSEQIGRHLFQIAYNGNQRVAAMTYHYHRFKQLNFLDPAQEVSAWKIYNDEFSNGSTYVTARDLDKADQPVVGTARLIRSSSGKLPTLHNSVQLFPEAARQLKSCYPRQIGEVSALVTNWGEDDAAYGLLRRAVQMALRQDLLYLLGRMEQRKLSEWMMLMGNDQIGPYQRVESSGRNDADMVHFVPVLIDLKDLQTRAESGSEVPYSTPNASLLRFLFANEVDQLPVAPQSPGTYTTANSRILNFGFL